MNKRDFIKAGVVSSIALLSSPVWGKAVMNRKTKIFTLPTLPYTFESLEPQFDGRRLQELYTYHQQLNTRFNTEYQATGTPLRTVRDILRQPSHFSQRFIALSSEYLNYKIFWRSLSPNSSGRPSGDVQKAILSSFGSVENLKMTFSAQAVNCQDTDWLWLVDTRNQLSVVATSQTQNPFLRTLPDTQRGYPLLGIPLAYRGIRSNDDYLQAFWQVANWDTVTYKLKNSNQI